MVIHKKVLLSDSELLDGVVSLVDKLRSAVVNGNNQDASCKPIIRWQAPYLGVLKINTDAALNVNGKASGLGVVIRDYYGKVVAFFCHVSTDCPNKITSHREKFLFRAWMRASISPSKAVIDNAGKGKGIELIYKNKRVADREIISQDLVSLDKGKDIGGFVFNSRWDNDLQWVEEKGTWAEKDGGLGRVAMILD
ncbi:hypothetical protein QYF36_022834 [Acer negundo]|nr:hypothetical protein QYF36_022834 [Acer negundo]